MKLTVGVLCCGLLLLSARADEKPIYDFPEWWSVRDFVPAPSNDVRVRGGKIIGGREATPQQFPYHVGLLLFIKDTNEVGLCSGAMLSPTRVVTVAHCVDIIVGCEAVFGAHFITRVENVQTRRRVQLSDITRHELYNPRNLTNDVAIINLRTPVATSSVVQVVKLPKGADLTNDFAGKLAVVTGWGRFSSASVVSKTLRFVEVKVIANEMCRLRFPTMIHNTTSEPAHHLSK
jgi:secreted trypsin-like serine protease